MLCSDPRWPRRDRPACVCEQPVPRGQPRGLVVTVRGRSVAVPRESARAASQPRGYECSRAKHHPIGMRRFLLASAARWRVLAGLLPHEDTTGLLLMDGRRRAVHFAVNVAVEARGRGLSRNRHDRSVTAAQVDGAARAVSLRTTNRFRFSPRCCDRRARTRWRMTVAKGNLANISAPCSRGHRTRYALAPQPLRRAPRCLKGWRPGELAMAGRGAGSFGRVTPQTCFQRHVDSSVRGQRHVIAACLKPHLAVSSPPPQTSPLT